MADAIVGGAAGELEDWGAALALALAAAAGEVFMFCDWAWAQARVMIREAIRSRRCWKCFMAFSFEYRSSYKVTRFMFVEALNRSTSARGYGGRVKRRRAKGAA